MTAASENHVLLESLLYEAQPLVPRLTEGTPVVYFLRLKSGAIYVGVSMDFRQRLAGHASGRACRTTLLDPPLALLRIETFSSFSEARTRESQLKRWSRAKKEALLRNDRDALKRLSRSRD